MENSFFVTMNTKFGLNPRSRSIKKIIRALEKKRRSGKYLQRTGGFVQKKLAQTIADEQARIFMEEVHPDMVAKYEGEKRFREMNDFDVDPETGLYYRHMNTARALVKCNEGTMEARDWDRLARFHNNLSLDYFVRKANSCGLSYEDWDEICNYMENRSEERFIRKAETSGFSAEDWLEFIEFKNQGWSAKDWVEFVEYKEGYEENLALYFQREEKKREEREWHDFVENIDTLYLEKGKQHYQV